MASVERAMAMAAAALLPGLLPTPPPPCIIVLPVASNPKFPKPGRADAAERWDAHKNDDDKTAEPRRSPASSSCGSSTSPAGRADSCLRWDINKKKANPVSSSSGSSSMSISGGERYKRPPSRASSAERWDAHKKPRAAAGAAAQAGAGQEEQKTNVDEEQPQEDKTAAMAPRTHLVFSGPSFVVASPEPSMLPMPAFFLRRAGVVPLPQFLQAH